MFCIFENFDAICLREKPSAFSQPQIFAYVQAALHMYKKACIRAVIKRTWIHAYTHMHMLTYGKLLKRNTYDGRVICPHHRLMQPHPFPVLTTLPKTRHLHSHAWGNVHAYSKCTHTKAITNTMLANDAYVATFERHWHVYRTEGVTHRPICSRAPCRIRTLSRDSARWPNDVTMDRQSACPWIQGIHPGSWEIIVQLRGSYWPPSLGCRSDPTLFGFGPAVNPQSLSHVLWKPSISNYSTWAWTLWRTSNTYTTSNSCRSAHKRNITMSCLANQTCAWTCKLHELWCMYRIHARWKEPMWFLILFSAFLHVIKQKSWLATYCFEGTVVIKPGTVNEQAPARDDATGHKDSNLHHNSQGSACPCECAHV